MNRRTRFPTLIAGGVLGVIMIAVVATAAFLLVNRREPVAPGG